MKPKFVKGDKVFAKVRGYPPWPARVEGLADETPNKMKYHIYFYGTSETGIVKAEDMYSYVDYKSKYGKLKKPKNFIEAILQIEDELSPEEKEKISDLDTNTSVSRSANSSVNESISEDAQRPKARPSTNLSESAKKSVGGGIRKRKLDDSTIDTEEKKELDSENSSNVTQISRSGRKIKQKKFADEKTGDELHSTKPLGKREAVNNIMSSTDKFLIVDVNNEKVKIPLDVERPVFATSQLEEVWNANLLEHANDVKERLQSGSIAPSEADQLMRQWARDEIKKYSLQSQKLSDHQFTEGRILELDNSIRNSLSIHNPDLDRCIKYLDALLKLNIKPVMLKKHPDIVITIKKVRRYVGNNQTPFTEEEAKDFDRKTETIRDKAEAIFNKFKSLFLFPEDKTFWEYFDMEKEAFYSKTKHLSSQDIMMMTEDLD